ncbi:MAG: putative TonB-dependent receptor [Bacteroidetes bacterium]|nr:putative TonB-dependent receptor [Bacteroidota bacterium]
MKKFLFALFLIIPVLLNAQNTGTKFVVKGQAVDSLTQETLPYVTCSVVMEKNPQQVVTRFASDLDGKFTGELKAAGNYIIVISCVGQQPASRHFSVSANNTQAQLGKIGLGANKQALKEVSVVATRPLIKADADKITYDAEQDPESKSSTVLDMLRKVPMVTVDGQDNIQLKGSGNFKFFLNGKPTNMFNNNPGLILKSIPANMVKNIEVITQPGAKYDAEGIGGIINIVTIQQSSAQGYSATISGQASSRGSYGGGLNLMIQSGKFSFSGNYNYSYNKQFPVTTSTERNSYVSGAPYPYGKQVATVENPTPMQIGSGQLSYELDTANLFTFSFNRQFGRPKSTTVATTENFDGDRNKIFDYTQNSTQTQSWGSTDLGVDYQHSFKKKGETLTLSYKLSNTPNSSNYEVTNTLGQNYTHPQAGLIQWSQSDNTASSNEHTFQADYSKPTAKGQTLEFGTKYILRLNSSETDEAYKYFDFSKSYPFTPYLTRDTVSNFDNNQDILGAYASYTANIGKWGIKGGLRYEYTWLNVEFNETERNFKDEYDSWVPSATLTYRLTDMNSLKLGYNMRIQRPSIGYLNPYVDRRDPNYISYGNPNLDPENSHNITLGYSSFGAKYNISAELAYTFVNNAIEQYSFIKDGSTVQEITYDNIGHNKQLGLNVFGSYRGLSWLNLYMNGNVNYVKMNSSAYGLSNDGFTGRMFLGGTFMLPKDFRISTGGGGNLPQITLQGSQSAFYFTYMALSKEFLKKRLTVALSAVYLPESHIILTTKGVNSTTGATTFDQRTDVHLTKNTEFRLNVSYRIGSMTAQVKKTKATISNDDQKMKENSSMGQSPM